MDWTSADASRRATDLTRQLMLERAQAYRSGGDAALGVYHDQKAPRVAADELARLLASAGALHDLAPPLTAYLRGFPSAGLPDSEEFLYWAVDGVGPDAAVSLHQLITYRPAGGAVMVVDKQLYASRYVDAALAVITIVPDPGGQAFHALVGARARSTALRGMMARVLRSQVEKAARDTAAMYLGWLRGSLMM